MTKVSEVVRVTTNKLGARRGDAVDDPTLLWQAMLTIGEKSGADTVATNRGVLGAIVHVSAWEVAESLFGSDDQEFIRALLKEASRRGMVKFRSKGSPGNAPTFWVRLTLPVAKSATPASRAERKLTAHEAGEDRAPAPVTVTKAERAKYPPGTPISRTTGRPVYELPAFTQARAAAHAAKEAESRDKVLAVLLASPEPMQLVDIARATGTAKASNESHRKAVASLGQDGLITSVTRGGITWYYPADRPAPTKVVGDRHRAYLRKVEAAVRKVYSDGHDAATAMQVAEAMGVRATQATRDTLAELVRAGRIREVRKGKVGAAGLYAPKVRRRPRPKGPGTPMPVDSVYTVEEATAIVAAEPVKVDKPNPDACSICGRPVLARGLCGNHYRNMRAAAMRDGTWRTGSPVPTVVTDAVQAVAALDRALRDKQVPPIRDGETLAAYADRLAKIAAARAALADLEG